MTDKLTMDTESNKEVDAALDHEISSLLALGGISTLGVCGLGGSGKTTACYRAAQRYTDSLIFETDWFLELSSAERHKIVEHALKTGDDITLSEWSDPSEWYDWDAWLDGLKTLKDGEELQLSHAWRQETGATDLRIHLRAPADTCVILVDGIYLLHPEIRSALDRVVYIDAPLSDSRKHAEDRDRHRSSPEHLAWKAALALSFDQPYFERYRSAADVVITL